MNRSRILHIVMVLASLFMLQVMSPAQAGSGKAPYMLHSMLTPCTSDDGVNCYWDAHKQGNGSGHSFYAIPVGKQICIKYWDAAYDRRHGGCFLP